MDANTFSDYLKSRYHDQLAYYEAAATKNQMRYKNFQWTLIVMSTLTTILAALPKITEFDLQYVIVFCSAMVTIITAALKTFQYQELWVSYRATIEQLKPEIYYYKLNVGDYGQLNMDKESLFVSRVEAILHKEHDTWPMSKKLKDAGSAEATKDAQKEKEPKLK